MKWVDIARYTSGDHEAVGALQQYGFWYQLEKSSDVVVTTLNRVKIFLEKYFWIQKPTTKLVQGILDYTKTWEYVWRGIDSSMNLCKLFKIHVDKFSQSVADLINEWKLRKENLDQW